MNKRLMSLLLVLALMLTMISGVYAGSGTTNDIKGSLVIVGGALGSTNAAVYDKFIELAGGKDKAKIGIIPAASGNLKSSNGFKADLVKYGVAEASIDIIPIAIKDDSKTKDVDESKWIENANKPEVAEKIKSYTAIWFVGGDQTRITQALLKADGTNTIALDAIWELYKKGGVIGGTSAGAAIMSNPMLAGGNSFGALSSGFTNEYTDENDQEQGPAYVIPGLGFFGYGIVDQHFDRKARLGRLVVVGDENKAKYPIAYGVDENTAMIFNNQTKSVEVAGVGGVTVVDFSKAAKTAVAGRNGYKDIMVSYIVAGDQFNLGTKTFTIDSSKDLTNDYEYYDVKGPIINSGIMSPNSAFKNFITYDLIDNIGVNMVKSYCFDDKGLGFELVFRKIADTKGYWGYKDGNLDSYSALNVAMDINPVTVTIKAAEATVIAVKPAVKEYVVKSGDMLWKIAKQLGISLEDIIKSNKLVNPNHIVPGQKLIY